LRELLNKVCDLGFEFAYWVFGWCVGIAGAGLISAGLACYWVEAEIRCRLTRQLVVLCAFESSLGFDLYLNAQKSPIEVQLTLNDRFTLATNALTDRCP
jgi:hypothetical protein